MRKFNVNKLIFSSSATVYGIQRKFLNVSNRKVTNPYAGDTKIKCEG